MAENEVWGFTIQKSPSGKHIWPKELKWEATRRIREEGFSPGEIAAELGAHECLVRKWSVADRRSRGEKITVLGPAFAELNVENEKPEIETSRPSVQHSECGRIRCGEVVIEFPLAISEGDLAKLVRVAGQQK